MARESAVARLRLAGSRATARLASLIQSEQPVPVRAAALSALEGSDDARALDIALGALGDREPAVAAAAVAVLRAHLAAEPGTRIFDALAASALDEGRDAAVRAAAMDALATLPRDQVQQILDRRTPGAAPAVAQDPAEARDWVAAHGGTAPLSALHGLLTTIREHEQHAPSPVRRQEWRAARGAVHAALAQRDSRVALYDLRETFEAADSPLPLDFLAAVSRIGDASCLEPMARAWAASPQETWWRDRLADAATAIMHRTRLSGRSAVVKRLRAKYDGFM